jgi:hypothetical protein
MKALDFLQKRPHLKWTIVGLATLKILTVLVFFVGIDIANAQFLDLPEADKFGDLADPDGEGLQKGYNAVWEVFKNFRYIIGAVATLFIIISGTKMALMGDNEEVAAAQKKNMYWGVIGLFIIMSAGPIAEVLDLQGGGFLSDEYEISQRAQLFDRHIFLILTFVKYIVGSVAVLFMIRSGIKLVAAGESDEVLTNEKKNIMATIFALVVMTVADVIVKQVLFKVDYDDVSLSTSGQDATVIIDTARGVQELIGITNFVVTWAAPFAVLALMVGAIMYVTAFGDEERSTKAKKVIINSMIALMIIYGSFALVSTLISGVF